MLEASQVCMTLSRESDKRKLESFLVTDPAVNIYAIGDLDPTCWADCVWDGLRVNDDSTCGLGESEAPLKAVALTYRGLAVPVLQILANPKDSGAVSAAKQLLGLLLTAAEGRLPTGPFEAHLNLGLDVVFREAGFAVSAHPHLRMAMGCADLALQSPLGTRRSQSLANEVKRLTLADADACVDLCNTLERSWFEPQCLDSGLYFGLYAVDDSDGDGAKILVAMGGTHVLALDYRLAALGNIATRASQRRKGYGRVVVSALCLALVDKGIHTIGLNVTTDNAAAIALYESLGFRVIMTFAECDIQPPRREEKL